MNNLFNFLGNNNKDDDTIKKIKKIKTTATIISAVSPFILPILVAVIAISVTFYTIHNAYALADVAIDTGSKLNNLLTMKGWNSESEVFFKSLKKENELFQKSLYKEEDSLDISLLASTIHYGRIIDPNVWSDEDAGDSSSDVSSNDAVPTANTAAFYRWANDRLGSSKTLIISERGLAGALVSTKVTKKCVKVNDEDKKTFTEQIDSIASGLGSTFFETYKDVITQFGGSVTTFINVMMDYASYNNVSGGNIISFISNAVKEKAQSVKTYGYSIFNTLDTSTLGKSLECGDDEVSKVVYQTFNDYAKYKLYLENFYIDQYIINCDNCKYKDLSDTAKESKKKKIISEIFAQRDDFRRVFNLPEAGGFGVTTYVPGNPSLPVPIAAGESLSRYISRGANNACYDDKNHDGVAEFSGYGCNHIAWDFAGFPVGTPVLAVDDGDVIEAGWHGDYGNFVLLGHDTDDDGNYDYYTAYGHMSAIMVEKGGKIGGGQQLGAIGSTGNSTGPHLHFELRTSPAYSSCVNPTSFVENLAAQSGVLLSSEYNGNSRTFGG